jgi:hypothetical protein
MRGLAESCWPGRPGPPDSGALAKRHSHIGRRTGLGGSLENATLIEEISNDLGGRGR